MQSWTASYAQTGDTLNCYTNDEMVKIVSRVIRARECDTLLSIANSKLNVFTKEVGYLNKIISSKDSIIDFKKGIISTKEDIIIGLNIEVIELRDNERRVKRVGNLYKYGFIGCSIGLVVALLVH